MSPIADLVSRFQDLVAQVPELLQPLIVALAGAVPFIEGEGASPIGVVGGIHPVLAGVSAALGNLLAVAVVVQVSSRARSAVVDHRAAHRETVAVGGGGSTATSDQLPAEPARRASKGRRRFQRWLGRFGVPGASLLGPLAIPTHITSAMLVAAGTPRARVVLWQAVAIAVWTTATTTAVWVAISALPA